MYDGKRLLDLSHNGLSPFPDFWHVNVFVREVGDLVDAQVVDILVVIQGSNNYEIHISLSRDDFNMPHFDGFPLAVQVPEAEFEVAHTGAGRTPPRDITGRRLFIFERAEGESNMWEDLGLEEKARLLSQGAQIRAALFMFDPPSGFTTQWLPEPLLCRSQTTIGDLGPMIGREDDNTVVGPIASAAKQSLANNRRYITSLYDWVAGCIIPAILLNPEMAVAVGFSTDFGLVDENGTTSITRVPKILFDEVPDYEYVINAGKDACHLWFALRDWRGRDLEGYFGNIGPWAERRVNEITG
ncbi:hypothetical protein P152DRAFT_487427 [Eremomyces bilateralis CBS 781.70]|uniref:Uncharacterized protein n=1 Tax=Eremomyces bilateralis CBS 781.70 TaxID=1392243 RepID=A0A6G1GHQ5_9PEZI|nr:uncharacterized protein P152DRAFT_487427 [Eremomyces bilateralis CBS 781.70]KAF1817608.1 hypothetical protein P152DRAFT_487427 [Eremomyces bilateralis CBS 781.70]